MSLVYVEKDESLPISEAILNPHYSDNRFKDSAQTVFLRPEYEATPGVGGPMVRGCFYAYNDRIRDSHSNEARQKAWREAREAYPVTSSALCMQEYLRRLFDAPKLILVHILSGVNMSNGYPYRVYGYIKDPDQKIDSED